MGRLRRAGKRGFKAVELPLRLKAHVASEVRKFQSANVVGMLPVGNVCVYTRTDNDGPKGNPGLADCARSIPTKQYSTPRTMIIWGSVPGMPGDKIYNGAADNGTGVGIVVGDGAGVVGCEVWGPGT